MTTHEPKFALGQTVMTKGIAHEIEHNETFAKEISTAFAKYCAMDWGDTCKEDAQLNDDAVNNGDDRIVAKYETTVEPIFIITEYDRSATTILFCREY